MGRLVPCLFPHGDGLAPQERHLVAVHPPAGRDERDAPLALDVALHDDAAGRDGARGGVDAVAAGAQGQRHQRLDEARHVHGVVAIAHEALALASDGQGLALVLL